jgi:hypothetical protein
MVMVNQGGIRKSGETFGNFRLLKASTSILVFGTTIAFTGDASNNNIGSVSVNYIDSPATTSATTYKTQFLSDDNTSTVWVQNNAAASSITLLEIGA